MALPRYLSKDHCQFLADMRKADRKIFHHEGLNFWKGPAVNIENLTELVDLCYETKVRVTYDHSRNGYTVHPEAHGEFTNGK